MNRTHRTTLLLSFTEPTD